MTKRKFIRREDLKELDHYTVDNGKYVGMKLGDVFDDLVISEQDIVKPYLDKLKAKMKERDEDNGGEPLNAVDRGYHLAFEHLCEKINNLLSESEQGEAK